MDILQPYKGTYVSADSASSKLDLEGILSGCDAVDSEASNLNDICNSFNSEGSNINEKALSFDGEGVEGILEEFGTASSSVVNNILETTQAIREAAVAAYNKIQDELNREAMARDQEAANKE